MCKDILKLLPSSFFLLIFIFTTSSCSMDQGRDAPLLEGTKFVSHSAPASDATGSSSEEEDELGRVLTESDDSHEEKILNVGDLQKILDLTKEFNVKNPHSSCSHDEFMTYKELSKATLNQFFQENPISTLRLSHWAEIINLLKDKIPTDFLLPIPGSVPYLLWYRASDAGHNHRYEDQEFLRLLSAFFNYPYAQRAVWQEMWYSKEDHTPEEMAIINFWDDLATAKGFPEEK